MSAFGLIRKVTPEQFADELERHLLGTDGEWGWDDTTSIAIADERLDNLRCPVTYREFADTLLHFQCFSCTSGGQAMKQCIASGLFLCALFVELGCDADRRSCSE